MQKNRPLFHDSNWTVPNILTVFRIFITPAFVVVFFSENYLLALILFVVAGITDGLDGFLARILDQRSRLGAMIDPLADKFMLLTAFICLGVQEWVPFWLIVVVISRDLIIIGGLFILHLLGVNIKNNISPTIDSKINTLFQILLLLIILTANTFEIEALSVMTMLLIYLVGFLTIFSGVKYVILGFSFLHTVTGDTE
ncbi:MAG: CDP-alcohol phosphatidyltransferase family protein [Desulfonatronovibrio sp.]|nr:CDP-alcohol phosphatidyltransferase family protein [Desulfovibrionales bacterium]